MQPWKFKQKNSPSVLVPLSSDMRTSFLREGAKAQSLFYSREGNPIFLEGMWKNQALFLVCSGPSAASLPLKVLEERGFAVMCVNNSWSMVRPQFWCSVDPPVNFLEVGWRDPAILKIVPRSHIRSRLSTKKNGMIIWSGSAVSQMPNVVFYDRNNGFDPTTFLSEHRISYGCLKDTTDAIGLKNVRSVLMVAIKSAYYLGFSRVYLVGCDFNMPLDPSKNPYAFEEGKSAAGRKGNNHSYGVLAKRLQALQDHIKASKIPFTIYNCNLESKLRVFSFKEFGEAVEAERMKGEDLLGTKGYYQKDWKREPSPLKVR
jgi:hypothetical protein